MPTILFIEKNGTLKEMKLKEVVPEELYRKASFKTAEGFQVQTIWAKPDRYRISLYARKTGRAGSENKYDFPPPVDKDLYFGGCILTNQDAQGNYIDLTKAAWERTYEELFGGFENLGSEDSEDESEDDKDAPRTKEGYVKDGFIVEDGEDAESESGSESESESEAEDDLAGDEDGVDTDTDELCEEDDIADSDSDSESEVEELEDSDADEEEDFYDSDGSGGGARKNKKKPAKKAAATKPAATKKGGGAAAAKVAPAPTKRRPPAAGGGAKSKGKKAVEPTADNGGYLNCSDELVEEAYVE